MRSAVLLFLLQLVVGCATAPPPEKCAHSCAPPQTIAGVENFGCVTPNLYRGAQPTAEGFAELQRRGIRTVVNLRESNDDPRLMVGTSLRSIHIPANASTIGEPQLERFLAVMADASNYPVFVHCRFGADRTGYVVGGYLRRVEGWDAASVIADLYRYNFHPIYAHIPVKLRELSTATTRAVIGH